MNPGPPIIKLHTTIYHTGELDVFVTFMDRNTQKTRIGTSLTKCYQTRNVADENIVNGETAIIALNITRQMISMTINGRSCVK